MSKLRLSLTIPGAVALGAYEGGALAALLVALQSLGEDVVVVDSIGGASAGSITALLTAQTLLEAKDPVTMMYQAWVEGASYESIKEHENDYPLNSAALSTLAERVLTLDAPTTVPGAHKQQEPVRVSLSLTSLAGLTYNVGDVVDGTTIAVATFQDWHNPVFDPTTTDWLAHAEVAIASGANAMGFPAKRLNRGADAAGYAEAGLQGFPADGNIWYTDGGTTDNEPLGRTIDIAQGIESDDDRLFLLIHYDTGPAAPTEDSPWSGSKSEPPPWVRAATRAMHASSAQSIFDDLKRLQKMNARLDWTSKIAPALAESITKAASAQGLSADQVSSLTAAVAGDLQAVLDSIRTAKDQLAVSTSRAVAGAPGAPVAAASLEETARRLVHEASGLSGRQHVRVDLVSPAIDTADQQQCAGAFMFHFGGFFDVRLRQNDFNLGYRNMTTWLRTSLASRLGWTSPDPRLDQALAAVDTARAPAVAGSDGNDRSEVPAPSLMDKATMLLFAGQIGQVVWHDARSGGL